MRMLVIRNHDGSYEVGQPDASIKEIRFIVLNYFGPTPDYPYAFPYVTSRADELLTYVRGRLSALLAGNGEPRDMLFRKGCGEDAPEYRDPPFARIDIPEELLGDWQNWPTQYEAAPA